MINILTRTSNREKSFTELIQNLKSQSCSDFNHLVCSDNNETLKYVEELKIKNSYLIDKEKLLSEPISKDPKTGPFAPYNLYMNFLQEKVNDGWIMYLDDDDKFISENSLQIISNEIQNSDEDTLIIWAMKFSNGFVVPKKNDIRNGPVKNFIGSPCFTFHNKYKSFANWDSWKCSDFRVVKKLWDTIPKKKYINEILIYVPQSGGGNV